ncbi:hypothetical protein M422DRAFT_229875 [Sphaerobolus stellatus SS14]|uniref:Elongation factor 1-gamma n=1 Tax=Sphaerobolus stellatus (strain SS14) TaxID=990650 RepID=A0A0C9UDA9_SPHS4|nr:hypothetical protein M422DRAFT_229875 [Sphaerobolus stellatus SS14]
MSFGTLYTTTQYTVGQRVLAVAALAGVKLDIPTDYKHHEDNLKEPFLAKFASGKIPALETKDGFTLFESTAIARYIAKQAPNANLVGSTNEEAAIIDQWVSFVDCELIPVSSNVHALLGGRLPYTKPLETAFQEKRERAYATLNNHLSTRTFFVGERITLADVHVASAFISAFKYTFDVQKRKQYPHITRHFETIINQPKLKPIFGDIPYCEKAIVFTPPAKKKEEKPKEAAAPKPKAEKPKAPEPEEEEEDDLLKEEPKAKNPLDSLPKSSFNLEDFKRAYSNMDTRGDSGSLKWFYEKFDKEGFSIWRVDFKYNDELAQVFMSSNQIGGFFNRLEASRKYLFGSVGVLGEANNNVITGVLICRGDDIKPVVSVAPDWESYSYESLNPFTEGPQKEFFEGAMAWDLELNGKKWADGKNFK